MKNTLIKLAIVLFFGATGFVKAQVVPKYKPVSVHYVNLSDNSEVTANPIQTKKLKAKKSNTAGSSIEIKLNEIINTNLTGVGGAFNEQGGDAFMCLDAVQQEALATNLFNYKKGIGFSMCRTAVGSSDFGLSAYSYSETPEDYDMKYFTVARDLKSVIPFIKAGYNQNPELKIFASPWSPPGWMKEYGKMDAGGIKKVGPDKRETWVNNGQNYLRAEKKIYQAYALYFTKYVQDYAKYGVTINRLAIQNEPDMNPSYPSCDMSPQQMANLAFNYIQPAFNNAGVTTEVWAGTFRGKRDDGATFIGLEGAEKIDGIALQYANPEQVVAIRKAGYPVMHTEGNCFNSDNSMEQARRRFGEVCKWFNAGSENFCYWNMVLNENTKSGWDWPQNSMIRIDRQSKTIIYNPDYVPMALFSKFIRPGSQSIKTVTPDDVDALAVKNDKELIVFLQNNSEAITSQHISLLGTNYEVELPVKSICAFVFKMDN